MSVAALLPYICLCFCQTYSRSYCSLHFLERAVSSSIETNATDATPTLLSQLLNSLYFSCQMEGANSETVSVHFFLLCATNCPWELDSAFIRRFQKRIFIPLPDK